MEYNDPSRRQYAQNQYTAQQQPHGTSAQSSGQYSASGTVERLRQSSYLQQSPTTVPSTGRASSDAQVYGFVPGTSQYGAAGPPPAQSMQYTGDMQQTSDVPRQQESSQYQQYGGASALYGMGQQAQQSTQSPYDQGSRYPQRPSTATETLASQFGVAQTQYYLAGQSIPTSATAPELAAPHLPSQYQQSAYAPAGPSSSQTYGSAMMDPSQSAYPGYSQYTPSSTQSVDQAFSNYQAQMRSIFSQVRAGSLREVGNLLMDASHYLIGNAEALGLTRDDDNLHDDRIRLWDEFNRAWLATLQMQFDMTQEWIRTAQPVREPRSLMSAQILEHLSREIVRLCDSVEKHGLVDYQMGVAEEEIMDLLLRCLGQLDPENATAGEESSGSTSRGR